MDETRVLEMTSLGIEEVRNRKQKLPPKLRSMLILIDGNLSEHLLRKKSAASWCSS